ncbi:MAG: hypothetical protein ACYDBZ_15245 [Steroidobacteraceae bacterium]
MGLAIPSTIQDVIKPVENARDKIMHGQGIDDGKIREAISRVLHYADQLNTLLDGRSVGFRARATRGEDTKGNLKHNGIDRSVCLGDLPAIGRAIE